MNLLDVFQQNLLKYDLTERPDQVLLAISGGIDSTVLLDLFYNIQNKFDLALSVIHINHGLRGIESDSDAEFVQETASRYHLNCMVKRVDTRNYALANKLSIEEAARILRYRFYDDMLASTKFKKVATAHNADDQAETILDHLMRGSGIRGLAGMSLKRDTYIRPLLTVPRQEIERYSAEKKLKFRFDTSNWELKYKRNRIRHELIPYIRLQFNPNISSVLIRTGEIFRETESYLMTQAQEAVKSCLVALKPKEIVLNLPHFLAHVAILQQYIIFHILEILGIQKYTIRYQTMDQLQQLARQAKSGTRLKINEAWEAIIAREELVFHQRHSENFLIEIKFGESYPIFQGEVTFRTQLVESSEVLAVKSYNPNIEYIDFDQLKPPLYLRNPRKGDKFRPLNMRGEKKLSDFFIDEKVPNYLRGRVPVLECEDGIIWVCGYRIDDHYKITSETKHVLRLEICEGCYE
ncbi:tRNA lysidine(34) synthetase TilS [candidate division KSB1 bacterium]|nr:tRNA lysidine(34) synthetase TilS [candidate division KSB1 bacterium]